MSNSTRLIKLTALALCNLLVSDANSTGNSGSSQEHWQLADASDLEKPPEVTEDAQISTLQVNKPDIEVISDGESEPPTSLAIEEVIPLELKLPYSDNQTSDELPEPSLQKSKANLFANTGAKQAAPIQLKGTVVMTSEQEVEKLDSPDGVGIAIDVKN